MSTIAGLKAEIASLKRDYQTLLMGNADLKISADTEMQGITSDLKADKASEISAWNTFTNGDTLKQNDSTGEDFANFSAYTDAVSVETEDQSAFKKLLDGNSHLGPQIKQDLATISTLQHEIARTADPVARQGLQAQLETAQSLLKSDTGVDPGISQAYSKLTADKEAAQDARKKFLAHLHGKNKTNYMTNVKPVQIKVKADVANVAEHLDKEAKGDPKDPHANELAILNKIDEDTLQLFKLEHPITG